MKQVERYVTSDGIEHSTEAKARRHAEERYGNALTALARSWVQIDKYSAMVTYIDQNLHQFSELIELKADMELQADRELQADMDTLGVEDENERTDWLPT